MALTRNLRMTGRAAQIHNSEVRSGLFERALRQQELNEKFHATAMALSVLMGDAFDAWYDSYPEEMSKADFLPIMEAKIADLQAEHAVELATALEPGPDEAAEIAALVEPETNAELRQGQNLTLNLPTRHVTREWAKRHLNVETNGFEAELDTAFGKGNWTLT